MIFILLLKFLMFSVLCISVKAKATFFERELDDILNVQDCLTASKNCKKEVFTIQVYYEVFCPDCIAFDTHDLLKVILKLSQYTNIKTYPYGNANVSYKSILSAEKTFIDNKGKITFRCQHGEGECYGNKLHACALDIITNHTEALLYNICMMDPSGNNAGSDDAAADRCAASIPADSTAIKSCAKSMRGVELLKYYGDETHKVHQKYVPWVLVNGKLYDQTTNDDFFAFLCQQFKNPPSDCSSILLGYYGNEYSSYRI